MDYQPFVGVLDGDDDDGPDIFYLNDDLPLLQIDSGGEIMRYLTSMTRRLPYDHRLIALTRLDRYGTLSAAPITIASFEAYTLDGFTLLDGHDAGEVLFTYGSDATLYNDLPAEALINTYTVAFGGPTHGTIFTAANRRQAFAQHANLVSYTIDCIADEHKV